MNLFGLSSLLREWFSNGEMKLLFDFGGVVFFKVDDLHHEDDGSQDESDDVSDQDLQTVGVKTIGGPAGGAKDKEDIHPQ